MSTIIAEITKTVTKTAASATPSSANRVTPQGGILEGANPSVYDSKNPVVLFIIQAGVIIIFCRLLHWPLSKMRQPRVIAEVIGGIILGPSVLMRIPGFKDAIFPAASMPGLSLVANVGLILFLFLVGLEVNMNLFYQNWRVALSVGLAGMLLPFGLGSALAYGLYHEFRNDPGTVPISFPLFMLFIGTALSITAFPVLCRILTELKLLSTPVGVTVLAAGVGNDVTGWILLALCVALVNNGSGLTALYVLLTCLAWILFLVFGIKPVFHWYLRKSGSLSNGPTQTAVMVTLLLVLLSSWFTSVIGVHAIFGAFVVGLICPHDGGFAIKLTEKLEDLISVLFLPLYFALSGLSTNIGLLNDGITWAYVIAVITVAFAGKIIGGTLAAKACKLVWRESTTIGVLMSCKGLVELIVLNIGLQAKILSTRTFTIFVVMALVTTFATTPLTSVLYPPWYQRKLESWKRGETDWDGNPLGSEGASETSDRALEKVQKTQIKRLLVHLRLDSLPSLFTFIALLGGDRTAVSTKVHKRIADLDSVPEETAVSSTSVKRPLEVHGLRLLELTERTSSVMKVSEGDYNYRDPVVNAFRTFAQLNNVAVSGGVSVVPEESYAETINNQASDLSSDLVLIPWTEYSGTTADDGSLHDFSSHVQNTFIQQALDTAQCNTAVFINRGFGGPVSREPRTLARTNSALSLRSNRDPVTAPIADRSHHIFFPFFGGADDRVALRFVLQIAQNSNITATIAHFIAPTQAESKTPEVTTSSGPRLDTQQVNTNEAQDTGLLHTLRDTLPEPLRNRVVFIDIPTTSAVTDLLSQAKQEVGQSPHNAGDLIVVGRGKLSITSPISPGGVGPKKVLGTIAESLTSSGIQASVIVIQAGEHDLDR